MKFILKGQHFPETQLCWICSQDIKKNRNAETEREISVSEPKEDKNCTTVKGRDKQDKVQHGWKGTKVGVEGSACEKPNPAARGGEGSVDAPCHRSRGCCPSGHRTAPR